VFDMDTSNQILLIARKEKAMGDVHLLTKVRFLNLKDSFVTCLAFKSLYSLTNFTLTFMETWLYRWAWYLHLRCKILYYHHLQMVLETCIFLLLIVDRPSMLHLGRHYQCSGIVALSTDSFGLTMLNFVVNVFHFVTASTAAPLFSIMIFRYTFDP
jgi:hypothetical protein